MAQTFKVYTDEGVHNAIIRGLRLHGVDVLTAPEADMQGKDDVEHLELAKRLQRALFTRDVDYLVLSKTNLDHAGIIYARQDQPIGQCIRRILHLWNTMMTEDIAGRVIYLSSAQQIDS